MLTHGSRALSLGVKGGQTKEGSQADHYTYCYYLFHEISFAELPLGSVIFSSITGERFSGTDPEPVISLCLSIWLFQYLFHPEVFFLTELSPGISYFEY